MEKSKEFLEANKKPFPIQYNVLPHQASGKFACCNPIKFKNGFAAKTEEEPVIEKTKKMIIN